MKKINTEQQIMLSDVIEEARRTYPGLNKETAISQYNYLQFVISKSRDIDIERLRTAYTKSALMALLLAVSSN